ncbi:hypothetical protein MAFF241648_21350 [Ralstonia solanacearum]|nr:hypothetical protein MAFF241648_21350 [Ralstonia solanacearum]
MKPTIITLAILIGVAGCKEERNQHINKADSSSSEKIEINQVASTTSVSTPETHSPAPTLKSHSTPAEARKAKRRAIYGAAGRMAVDAFQAKDYFGSLVATLEGWRPTFYYDNKGAAVAFGWNWGMNTASSIKNIAGKAQIPSGMVQSAIYLAGDKGRPVLPSAAAFTMSEQQGLATINALRYEVYEKTARAALGKDFDKLTPYQQAVAVYHVYKTGNYAHWQSLTYSLKKCANGQDKAVCADAAKQFTYSYSLLSGERIKDTRSQTYMGALFQDPEAFAYLIGVGGVPVDMPVVNKSLETPIDTKSAVAPSEQILAKDTFGDEKDEMVEQGKTFDLVPESVFEKPFIKAHPEFSHVDMSGVPITPKPKSSGNGTARVTNGWF